MTFTHLTTDELVLIESYFNPQYQEEFGYLEGDTIVGAHHKSAVIMLVERQSKAIIPLKLTGHEAKDIAETVNKWLRAFPAVDNELRCDTAGAEAAQSTD